MAKFEDVVWFCNEREGLFGRPVSWHGQAKAVAFGENGDRSISAVRVEPLGPEAFSTTCWAPTVEELLMEWETVEEDYLYQEQKLLEKETTPL